MKCLISIVVILISTVVLASCSSSENQKKADEEEGCEIAMIAESADVEDGSFTQATWESVKSFSEENGVKAKVYKPKEASQEQYMTSIKEAADDGAGFIVLAGSGFETTAYAAQSQYADLDFLLIDGVPHDENNTYATAANMVSVVFAEEEAGYMAGYAAVKEGYTKLGFMGGQALPSVKRYGYGFVQGAAAAAAEDEVKVEMNYKYTGVSKESEETEKLASQWYESGIQVIFASGGSIGKSVIKAAEKSEGKVIGSDMDQSSLSETVITSAVKGIDSAVETVLKSYIGETFTGGTAFNYAAKNDGVKLEMEKSSFKKFTEENYKKIFNQLKNGKTELKKDTGVGSVTELTGEWVTIKE